MSTMSEHEVEEWAPDTITKALLAWTQEDGGGTSKNAGSTVDGVIVRNMDDIISSIVENSYGGLIKPFRCIDMDSSDYWLKV